MLIKINRTTTHKTQITTSLEATRIQDSQGIILMLSNQGTMTLNLRSNLSMLHSNSILVLQDTQYSNSMILMHKELVGNPCQDNCSIQPYPNNQEHQEGIQLQCQMTCNISILRIMLKMIRMISTSYPN